MSNITIIVEAGINHNGNMDTAKELILRAKYAGADVWKTQIYDVAKMFPNKQVMAQGKNWYDKVLKTQLNKEHVLELSNYCKRLDIEFMASAFDIERLGWLEEIGVKRHKLATSVNKNRAIIEAMIATDKEILYSCQSCLRPNVPQYPKMKFLYCIPKYPTSLKDLYLTNVDFGFAFQGFSDHTIGIEASMVAMSRGALIIEKHFCLKRDNSNPDMICSIEPHELKELVSFARKVEEIL